ncbi:diguanylate phosphodiesterase [Ligilactobacillus salitolerans]|uniref:Diguanylate phosphodiesterase n=1 Tax=Ligilactobacillus salitolerans TaxID=1808352 RepID=A0A401IUU3_9LACO|nr:EAL domain-containing protein [Ligilactobacillus salitolerans]GBG95323.1 diguanylate phosphodiesterase [Ligilactobacillus salitolerans]
MYRYFTQPFINKVTNTIVGYELLIREFSEQRWSFPANLKNIPFELQTQLLQNEAARIKQEILFVSFNLNRSQFMNANFAALLTAAQKRIAPLTLILEITEETAAWEQDPDDILAQMTYFKQHGILLSFDDVGTGMNTYENIKVFLPHATEIKFALQNYRANKQDYAILTDLYFWREIAQRYCLTLIVEGIETLHDEQLLDQMKLSYRQGYYYGKPALLE